jgi:putative oligomerization/nucleic acid binding protein
MRRIGCLLGTFLVVFAFVALAALVIIPVLPFGENNPALMAVKGALLCSPGQKYVMEGRNFSDNRGSGRTFQVYCVSEDGTKVNVMDKDFVVSIVIYLVPFLTGLFLIIGSSASAARRKNPIVLPGAPGVKMTDDGIVSVGGMQIRVQPGAPMSGASDFFHAMQQPVDLAGKLEQLEQARSKGLITQDEYDRMRKHILDESM